MREPHTAGESLGTRGERHELRWRGLNPGDEVFKQGRLAGTGLAGQTYGTNPAGSNSVEVLLQHSKFIVATQKWPLHTGSGSDPQILLKTRICLRSPSAVTLSRRRVRPLGR